MTEPRKALARNSQLGEWTKHVPGILRLSKRKEEDAPDHEKAVYDGMLLLFGVYGFRVLKYA